MRNPSKRSHEAMGLPKLAGLQQVVKQPLNADVLPLENKGFSLDYLYFSIVLVITIPK